MATDLAVLNGKEVTRPQPCAVGCENPRRQQNAVLACASSTLHLSCSGHPSRDLGMIQSNGTWRRDFDAAERAQYTLVQMALVRCETHKRAQHATVVAHGGGREMSESRIQVGVDPIRSKVAGLPGQTLCQDSELLQVSGGTADPSPVLSGKLADGHVGYSNGWGEYRSDPGVCTPQRNRYNRQSQGRLAQLYSSPWASLSWPIVRVSWVAFLAAFIFLRWSGFALTCLVLGQLAQAAVEYRRVYGRKRAPRRGPA
jgi:hypothetical protein